METREGLDEKKKSSCLEQIVLMYLLQRPVFL